jgi:hypothetical protein
MARISVEATETMARAPSHTSEHARYSQGQVGVDRSTEPLSTFAFFLNKKNQGFSYVTPLVLKENVSTVPDGSAISLLIRIFS